MFVSFPFRLGYIYVGQDHAGGMNVRFAFSIGKHVGGDRHRFNMSACWNWLPDRFYESVLSNSNGVDSSRWTGRSLRLARIGRWQHFASLIRIKRSRKN